MNNINHSIIDVSTHIRSNLPSNRNAKWLMTSLIIIIVSIVSIIGVIRSFSINNGGLLKQLRRIEEISESLSKGHSNESFRQSDDIIEDISKEKYIGNWTTFDFGSDTESITKENKGRVEVEFALKKVAQDKYNEPYKKLIIKAKCYDGKYIDNWASFRSNILLSNVNITNNTQTSLSLEGNYTSLEFKGKLFTEKLRLQDSTSFISIFLNKDSNSLIDLNNIITLTYSSSNGSHIHLSLTQNIGKHSNSIREKISFYTFIASTTATISMIINFYLIKLLTQAESNIKAMSIIFITINAIWNLLCFIINFSFAIKFNEHFFQFIIPSFLFLCLFLLVDSQYFYYYFIIRRKTLSDRQIKWRCIAFGLLASVGFGVSCYFIYDLFFDKIGIIAWVITLWFPLIIHNVISNNKTAMPMMYTSLVTITRLSILMYFRGFDNNCFAIETDKSLMIKCIVIEVIMVMWLGSQSLLGARWFLPKCLKKNLKEEIYFYSEKDAMDLFPNYLDEECVICLNRLFNQVITLPDLHTNNDDSHSVSDAQSNNNASINTSQYIKIKNPNENGSSESLSSASSHISIEMISSIIISSLSDFHEWKFKQRKNNLPYMITQCNHLFHSHCLELWLRQVKKCPSCRKEITIIPI